MKNLRSRFARFCLRNRDKGIPNLMLYIALGNAVVTVMAMINGGSFLYSALCFDKAKILQGEVWRLVTYVFTQSGGGLLELLFLYFFYILGRHVEVSMGTLRFNLFYLSGVVLMDVFAMIFCPVTSGAITTQDALAYWINTVGVYQDMAYYLHLSLILMFATTHPDAQFMIFFIIPIKAKYLAWVYLGLTLIDLFRGLITMFRGLRFGVVYLGWLFPIIALLNYFLFYGSSFRNLLPQSMRFRKVRSRKPAAAPGNPNWAANYRSKSGEKPYRHKCTVCGRTDTQYPDLEFRYCSRCAGYHCYCIDHINNHVHITE